MATRRRSSNRPTTTGRRTRRRAGGALPVPRLGLGLSPAVARSLVGILLLVLGAVLLIALALPGDGRLTDWVRDAIVPFFGAGRYLLPFVLLLSGWYVEWGPGKEAGAPWGRTLVGIAVSYTAFLGIIQLMGFSPAGGDTGGRIGSFLERVLVGPGGGPGLLPVPAAYVVLVAVLFVGLLLAFDMPLRQLLAPITSAGRALTATLNDARTSRAAGGAGTAVGPGKSGTANGRGGRLAKGTAVAPGTVSPPGQTGIWGEDATPQRSDIPSAVPSPIPTSATFAPARAGGAAVQTPVRADVTLRPIRDPDDVTDGSDSPPTRERIEYILPSTTLLDDVAIPLDAGGDEAAHRRNEEIIVRKLSGFNIAAQITGRNAGPVVTQYEVQPAADIKVSRIEALADDLAMALAARSLRIEAPIPGKSAVGIEIPNQDFNIVGLRRILEEVDFTASGSRLTFALGRDVAGKAQAVDLAKMPHLLIAGATGSGKSVMVNALIASLLCEATPDDIRMILVDLKRVELAAYNGLPHLLVPVITEPERAKAALKWAVNEMEARYRRLAGASARNIKGFNETRADPEDRMPYIVIVVDELADLMMREGRNVEDPIVRLAQKARATGIHMVLATQRPSVNVVTGLIKANFPSRIAFAMASQIDSRTILDTPGAEDLIGRGDMLYQPSDLPRPMRLQGVFVSDAEIARVVTHWKDQIDGPHYDLSITENDEESSGSVDDLSDDDADRLLHDAIDVIREYDRASASLLQRRLKVGYARAARMIDQLEARGYIGAFDGSNARPVLRREAAPGVDDEVVDTDGDDR
jgi:DNA segregation ATPase FtsK/SpoIIIE, S-DNA-T family